MLSADYLFNTHTHNTPGPQKCCIIKNRSLKGVGGEGGGGGIISVIYKHSYQLTVLREQGREAKDMPVTREEKVRTQVYYIAHTRRRLGDSVRITSSDSHGTLCS